MVSRLVHQKGLDIVADTAREIVREGGQIAILGLGDPDTEHMLSRLARSHRDHIGLLIGFNEPMARRIVAASDFCLMPSRFEPCGLTQMQAQRYGALPIAHRTGGLADTIEDGETGFLFSDLSGEGLFGACRRAFEAFDDPDVLAEMRQAAMARSFHWSGAAAEYELLYARADRPASAATGARNSAPAAAFGRRAGRSGLTEPKVGAARLEGIIHAPCRMEQSMSRPPLPPFTGKPRRRRCAWPKMPGTRAIPRASHWPTPWTAGGEPRGVPAAAGHAIEAFLTRKWQRELDYRLIKEVWAFRDNRIAVRFAYEWHDDSGNWFRSYGNENWEFDEDGLMRRAHRQHQRSADRGERTASITGRLAGGRMIIRD